MDLYRQEVEARLLAACLGRLEERSAVDVGAERGSLVAELLAAGSPSVHAIEPDADNVAHLRASFGDDPRVTIHAYAVGREDGELGLHKAIDSSGAPVPFGHTVLELPDADEIAWRETVAVPARSLASLVASGELPRRVGIVKIDTEGHDRAVVAGMGELECDVVMVEHWTDLPRSLGRCPWSAEEMTAALRTRGFSNFAFVTHHGELVLVQWNDAHVATGHMGNLVFLHDRVVERLLPVVIDCATSVAVATIERLERERDDYAHAAMERLEVIEKLALERDEYATAARERLEVIERLATQQGLGS